MMKGLFFMLAMCAVAFADTEETEAVVVGTFSEEERAAIDESAETHEFEAEVNRLMDIIIHSLYSNREIFMRELVSNAADASDKVRFLALTDSSLLADDEELDIRIKVDSDKKMFTITDKGVGMTKDDLIKNLGVVAKSGTTDFVEAAASGEDPLSLIGQFGVGFYSVYLVADKVTVASKNANDEQYIWESTANEKFTVAKDPRGNTLGRGTEITLYMKEDALDMINHHTIKDTIKKYSQFIDFPIYLEESKTVEDEVPVEDDEEETEKAEGDDDVEVSEEEDAEEGEKKPKTKTVERTVKEWNRINDFKAIWTRDPSEVSDEEYDEFYETFGSKARGKALDRAHFTAEGEISFRSLMYIQEKGEPGRYNNANDMKQQGVKLYVRRVLISEEFEDFLPKYMNFVRGVVDSDDLPINVSRETLAQNRVLKVIGKKLVRKVLELLRKMADAEEEDDAAKAAAKAEAGEDADAEKSEDEEQDDDDEEEGKYTRFWNEHGKAIKFGVMDDRKNKAKLTKLLRYPTANSNGKAISLDRYVESMPENQKKIYFLNCETVEKCSQSPFIEKLVTSGFDVLFMIDVVDEYLVQHMTEYEGIELQNVLRENMKLGKEDRKAFKALKEDFKPTVEFLKDLYGERVTNVKVSNKLENVPCVVTASQYGWTANLERIMKSQTFGGGESQGSPKILEINPRHPIMKAIRERVDADDTAEVGNFAELLLDGALLNSGFSIDDYSGFQKRMNIVVETGLDVDPDAEVEEEPEDPEEEEEEEDAEEAEEAEEAVEAEDETSEDEDGAKTHEEL